MRHLGASELIRDARGEVVLGGYPVRVYREPINTLPEPLPVPYRRGILFFDPHQGVMLVWDGGGVDFFDLSWVKRYVLVER